MTVVPSALSRPSLVLADLVPRIRGRVEARNALLVLAGTGLITLTGWVTVPLPFTPVPLSLSTFGVLLVGASLGPVRGSLSAVLYLVLGVVGLPMFATGGSGWQFASFGYIVGNILAAACAGAFARRRADRRPVSAAVLAVASTLMFYVCGLPWLAAFTGMDAWSTIQAGLLPFLVGDAIKAVAVAALLPTAWKLVPPARR